ncbi:MAG: DNA cytosine methyltransferase [Synergistaceae bacterium]|jgi:DNA (cytosine-5)-methyltransferase 1|nr:DNA cytosine methyltransferase [Synergistaceae bacterium]
MLKFGYQKCFDREMNTIPDAISVKQAADIIGVSEQRVRTLLRSGSIEGRQIGKQWLTTETAVQTYISNGASPPPENRPRPPKPLPEIKALSFFSGAMGLDQGLEKAGIHFLLACESDKACRRTISANRPDIALIGDIWEYDANQIRIMAGLSQHDEIDVIVGGPPCQSFSTAGARRGFEDKRGSVLLRYINLILEMRPRFAVIENVRGLLSAPLMHTPHAKRGPNWMPSPEEKPGGALLHVMDKLRAGGYGISFNLYNAANFGVPQSRERVIILCSRDGEKLPHLIPTHSQNGNFDLPKWRTLRDAFSHMNVQSCDHEDFPEDRLRFYRMLGSGQYWKHLPKELHREALRGSLDAGGGKTGFLRRLDWDKPSCTLVTSPIMPATDICHPEENRPLSIQEYARIQQFPDNWVVCGSLADRYRQLGNAVPVGLGEAVGRTILAHMKGEDGQAPARFPFSRYKDTDEVSWELRTLALTGTMKSQEKMKQVPEKTAQLTLFAP